MKIIVDSNIIIAALIRDSITRKLIIDLSPDLYFPKAMLDEIKKYKSMIMEKTGLSEDSYILLFEKLFKYIRIVPDEHLVANKLPAQKIMGEIDPKDSLLIACAFSFEESVIWSNDPHLKKQKKIETYTTEEIILNIEIFLKN